MSARAIKKLYGDKNFTSSNTDENDFRNREDIVNDVDKTERGPINRFSLLDENEEISSSDEDCLPKSADGTRRSNLKSNDHPSEKLIQMKTEAQLKGKKKKKKMKLKAEKYLTNNLNKDDDDDIFKQFQEENLLYEENSSNKNRKTRLITKNSLTFTIQHCHLDPDVEMRRVFGSRALENQRRINRRSKFKNKQSWLVQRKEGWFPPSKIGLMMERDKEKENFFVFHHSKTYQNSQFVFWNTLQVDDVDSFQHILQSQPYHIDTLLQMSEILRISEDSQTASDLVDRALFAMECSFHPAFNLTTGLSKLDYQRCENRAFFIALFLHARYLSDRTCHRTALEICKLLMNCNSSDPVAAKLIIDYYALRSKEYEFLINYYNEMKNDLQLFDLPNFSYSVALAYFLKGDTNMARKMLTDAIEFFPGLLKSLAEKLGLNADWSLFMKTFELNNWLDDDCFIRLFSLYIDRIAGCWKRDDILDLLRECTELAIERSKSRKPSDLIKRRRMFGNGLPRAILRHFVLCGVNPPAQSIKSPSDTSIVDPFPPENGHRRYKQPKPRTRHLDGHLITNILRSLNPRFNVIDATNHIEPDDENGAVGGISSLANITTSFIERIRDTVRGINFIPPPNDLNEPEDPQIDDD